MKFVATTSLLPGHTAGVLLMGCTLLTPCDFFCLKEGENRVQVGMECGYHPGWRKVVQVYVAGGKGAASCFMQMMWRNRVLEFLCSFGAFGPCDILELKF